MKTYAKLASGLSALAAVAAAYAGSDSTTMTVSATLEQACTIAASPLSFGTLPNSQVWPMTTTVSVNCVFGAPFKVSMDAGQHYDGLNRHMADTGGGGGQVTYSLYRDADHIDAWGDSDFANTFPWGSSAAGTGNGASTDLTVYGVVEAGTGSPGSYSDSVVVTVEF